MSLELTRTAKKLAFLQSSLEFRQDTAQGKLQATLQRFRPKGVHVSPATMDDREGTHINTKESHQ